MATRSWIDRVAREGLNLGAVPQEHRTAELCLLAVHADGDDLAYVPVPLRTSEMCMAAIQSEGATFGPLLHVPLQLRTSQMCLAAVQQKLTHGGNGLRYVPEVHRTQELCRIAVENDGWALSWVPDHLRTPEMCVAAVRQNKWAFRALPVEKRTIELLLPAVLEDMSAVKYAPVHLQEELAQTALKARKPLEDRITVQAGSASTTQHQLTVLFDGVPVVTVDNSLRGEFPRPGRPYFGDYRDWMEQSVEEATPWLKLWFVQRFLRFTSEPLPVEMFERKYDASIAELVRLDHETKRRVEAGESWRDLMRNRG